MKCFSGNFEVFLTTVLHLLVGFILAMRYSITGELVVYALTVAALEFGVDVARGVFRCRTAVRVKKTFTALRKHQCHTGKISGNISVNVIAAINTTITLLLQPEIKRPGKIQPSMMLFFSGKMSTLLCDFSPEAI